MVATTVPVRLLTVFVEEPVSVSVPPASAVASTVTLRPRRCRRSTWRPSRWQWFAPPCPWRSRNAPELPVATSAPFRFVTVAAPAPDSASVLPAAIVAALTVSAPVEPSAIEMPPAPVVTVAAPVSCQRHRAAG